jgi:hypothetical protein
MAGSEHQTQEVVANMIVDSGVEIGGLELGLQLTSELLVLPLDPCAPPIEVDRTMLCRGHQPGARVVRDARLGPLLERGHERVLRQIFGVANVAHHARETCYQLRRLDPPDRVDRTMYIGMCHVNRLNKLYPPVLIGMVSEHHHA